MRRLFFTYSVGCNDTPRAVRARAVYAGTRAVVWEDSANALQSSADAALAGYYQRLGRLFDEEQYEVVRANFGDPLRRDALTDGDGRVHMVFTQHVNALGGVAAFVTSCDQFTGPGAAGSNVGEFFYGSVPTRAGSGPTDVSYPDGWFGFMARTVVHEVKHVASTAARLANFSFSLEQGWLEEATARHAEEIWVRGAIHRVPWKGNTGFGAAAANGLYCDFHLADAACVDVDPVHRPGFGMQRHFNELRPKLLEPWNWSPFGDGTEQSGSVFYQTGWSLVRYTIDRYGTSDAAFLRALTNAIATGMANLTAVAGASTDQLLGNWGVALFADDYPGLSAPSRDIDFPTWNLRDIYLGLSRDPLWATRFRTPFPVEPVQLTFGGFAAARPGLRGGAHAYFELSGTMREAQLLELRAPGGGPASPNGRLAIARLQ
jgi:hypothetical protein